MAHYPFVQTNLLVQIQRVSASNKPSLRMFTGHLDVIPRMREGGVSLTLECLMSVILCPYIL